MIDDSKRKNIVKKVKGLLAISKDKKNDEESQSAFILAQKLMIQYSINKYDVEDFELSKEPIGEDNVTIYKKIFWWERYLSDIIAKNFKVKLYTSSKLFKGNRNRKTKIVFYGLKKDLELAKEMYLLAYEVLLFHSREYINTFYKESESKRDRYITESIKSNYIRGFLEGLEGRFEEQVATLRKSYEVLVLIPKKVEDSFSEYSADFGKTIFSQPKITIEQVYIDGKNQAKEIDFTKSSIYTDYSSLIGQCIIFSEGATSGLFAKIEEIQGSNLLLTVINTTSVGASLEKPIIYSHTLSIDYPYEFIEEKNKIYIEKILKKYER